jgi:hypothetical protein
VPAIAGNQEPERSDPGDLTFSILEEPVSRFLFLKQVLGFADNPRRL